MAHSEAVVSLLALEENYRRLQTGFPGKTLCPVIKSDAYGHGAVEVARSLSALGCRHFCVFLVEEAQALRAAGVSGRLFLLEGSLTEEIPLAAELGDCALAVWSRENLEALSAYGVAHGKRFDCHLKIDTGMSRLGFFPDEVPEVLELIRRLPGVRLCGAFSHLASADDPSSPQTAVQVERFRAVAKMLPPEANEVHLCAAPGMMANAAPEFQFVRPGVILYGYGQVAGHPELEMRPVMSFRSRITSLKRIPGGEKVSYGGTWQVPPEGARIAVVPVGYADGYPRALGNRASVLVGGRRCPIRGRVCMGMLMADVTQVPEAKPGDEVVLLGRQGEERIDAAELAGLVGTIPYELVCSLGKSPHRRFVR